MSETARTYKCRVGYGQRRREDRETAADPEPRTDRSKAGRGNNCRYSQGLRRQQRPPKGLIRRSQFCYRARLPVSLMAGGFAVAGGVRKLPGIFVSSGDHGGGKRRSGMFNRLARLTAIRLASTAVALGLPSPDRGQKKLSARRLH